MTPDKVQVVIFDAPTPSSSSSSSCACGCGGHDHHETDADPMDRVSMEMQTRALALTLETAFPGRVEVEYINVLKDPRGPSLPQTALLGGGAYPSPLVYIDGQGRFAGALVPERIREEVARILEAQ